MVFILAILLLVPIVCGKDVHVFPEVSAIAERCGDVAVQSSSSIFSMVLRLEIPTPRISQWHCHNGSTNYRSYPERPNNNYSVRKRRFILPLISMVTGIGGLDAGIYSAIEIQAIKSAQAELRDHVRNLQTRVEVDHQEMVELEKIHKHYTSTLILNFYL